MNCKHLTVASASESEITIQRSRFITSLRNVQNREQVDFHLKEICKLYPKATHYCWAYRFACEPVLEHSSDAGEPAGSAGRPILGALKKSNLLNILAVVTRYYGGVKLGIKGLISAYGESTLLAVQNAEIITAEPLTLIKFKCDYDTYNTFLARLKAIAPEVEVTAYFTERISGEFIIPTSIQNMLSDELDKLSPTGKSFEYTYINLDRE